MYDSGPVIILMSINTGCVMRGGSVQRAAKGKSPHAPLRTREQDFVAATWDRVMSATVKTLTEVKAQHGASTVAGIVGAKATNEEAYLLLDS